MAETPDPQDELQPLSKLRSLVKHAESAPVSCALGLTKDRTALLLLDKAAQPTTLRDRLKTEAKAALEPNSLRCGRISIDAQNDPGTVRFALNKNEAAGMAPALLRLLRKAGYQAVAFNADPALESNGTQTGAAAPSLAATEPPEAGTPPSVPPPPPPAPPAPDAAALARMLAQLIPRIPAAAAGNAALQQRLAGLASAARESLRAAALPAAAQRIGELEQAIVAAAQAQPLGPAGGNGAAVALTKAVLLWDSTRKYLEGQIRPLQQAILEHSADQHDFEQIRAGTPILQTVLERLDARLSDKLNQIHATDDAAARLRLRQEAKTIVGEYQAYMAGEQLVGALDGNPFTKFDGVARVQATLQAIVTYL